MLASFKTVRQNYLGHTLKVSEYIGSVVHSPIPTPA